MRMGLRTFEQEVAVSVWCNRRTQEMCRGLYVHSALFKSKFEKPKRRTPACWSLCREEVLESPGGTAII